LTTTNIKDNGGERLLFLYRDIPNLVNSVLSNPADSSKFLPWKFSNVPKRFWLKAANRMNYLFWLKDIVGVVSLSELNQKHYLENYGGGLLNLYHYSPSEILASVEKELAVERYTNPSNSDASGFSTPQYSVPSGKRYYFDSLENQRKFADHLAVTLGFEPSKDINRWYSVNRSEITQNGGGGLLRNKYGNSIYHFLTAVYPELQFDPWRFPKSPKTVLNVSNLETLMPRVIQFVENSLNLRTANDWNRVTEGQLRELRVGKYFELSGGKESAVQRFRKT